jgi:hypothetical protein
MAWSCSGRTNLELVTNLKSDLPLSFLHVVQIVIALYAYCNVLNLECQIMSILVLSLDDASTLIALKSHTIKATTRIALDSHTSTHPSSFSKHSGDVQ